MKIIVINGSPRTNGITESILRSVESELISRGIDVEFFNLTDLDIGHCLGCCSCFMTGHCIIKDDADRLSEKIKHADGLVLGSPTYASNVSGLMKDFIDRGHFVIEQLLKDKYCITVATGENYGFKNTLKVLDDLIIFSGGILCGHVSLKAPFNSKEIMSKKTRKLIIKATCKMAAKKKNTRNLEKQIAKLEREIEKQEVLLAEYEEKIQAAATDYAELSRLMEEKTAEDQTLAELYARWETLSGELEA